MTKIRLDGLTKLCGNYLPFAIDRAAGGKQSKHYGFNVQSRTAILSFRGIEYACQFSHGKSGQVEFLVTAKPDEKDKKIVFCKEKLKESQREVNDSRHIFDRAIEPDGICVIAECRIKRISETESLHNNPLFEDIFRYIYRELFRSVSV